jgi:hypothetical protein
VQILEFLSYRNSCKKFLRKRLKTGFFKTPPKPRSCEEIPPKKQEKKEILRNPGRNGFWGSKKGFLKTGIGDLVSGCILR